MKATKQQLMVIEGTGAEFLDYIGNTCQFELEGLGSILTTTEDLKDSLKEVCSENILQSLKGYNGYVLLRK